MSAGQQKWAEGYVDVRERMEWFFAKYPKGSLQAEPLPSEAGLIIVRAFAYRDPDDPRPGTGLASEPFPGRTPYTKDSELMNAETSAWGRALAAIGAPTKDHIASSNEVRNRRAETSSGEGVSSLLSPSPEEKPSGSGGGSPSPAAPRCPACDSQHIARKGRQWTCGDCKQEWTS